jgi:multicomponent Na+:H+ antiporter subunit G
MTLWSTLAWCLMLGGTLFFVSGAIGLLRFPDIYTRLHAVVKTDTLGLGLLAAGLAMLSASWLIAMQLLLIWVLAMASAAVNSQLLARYSLEEEQSDAER